MPKIVLGSDHVASLGGGEKYTQQLAQALNKMYDFYILHNTNPRYGYYHGPFETFKQFDGSFQPDIFISLSHSKFYPPLGKINALGVFFPQRHLTPPEGYDRAICLCPFVADWVERRWGLHTHLVYPAIKLSDYGITHKRNKIVNIGHFFEEPNGHSKNQHILINTFKMWNQPSWELILIGGAFTEDELKYLNYCAELAKDHRNIKFLGAASAETLRKELSEAKIYWHANGFGRTEPAETEHFGIVVLEALASGVVPIVHDSGGAPDIATLTLVYHSTVELLTATNLAIEMTELGNYDEYQLDLQDCVAPYTVEKQEEALWEIIDNWTYL